MEQQIAKVISAVGEKGGMGNVMDALGYSSADFQSGFEIANEMQNQDLVKLLYSNFNQNNIVVEFTLLGEEAYQKLSE